MPDKTIKCRDCGARFTFTEKDQEFYKEKGYTNEPSRCPKCRAARKSQPRENNRGGYGRSEREMFPAVCSECGAKTTVPFQPSPGKPVYCQDCFRRMKR
jgi:CxxC-x17-CxxC domain-containing protein